MPVYCILAGEAGPYCKIGKADDPAARMRELQTGHYETLVLAKVWLGSHAEEAALHRAFSEYNHRGEWFRFAPAMLDANPAELIKSTVCPCKRPDTPLKQYLDSQRISVPVFAERIGVSATAVYRYLVSDRLPRPHVMHRIVEATSGQVTINDLYGHDEAA